MDMGIKDEPDYITFCWGECASRGAAISNLAVELKPSFLEMTKADREALARIVIMATSGRIQGESHAISWIHAETTTGRRGDVLYIIEK